MHIQHCLLGIIISVDQTADVPTGRRRRSVCHASANFAAVLFLCAAISAVYYRNIAVPDYALDNAMSTVCLRVV